MTKPSISRSPGVASGYFGILVGSGGSGATADLDREVERAAELLREAYGMDVTIRFNTDRMSGGAWLQTDAGDRLGKNSQIGITVALTVVAKIRALYEKHPEIGSFEARLREDGYDPANPPDAYLTRSIRVDAKALKDPSKATCGVPTRPYAWIRIATLEEGLVTLKDIARLPPPRTTNKRIHLQTVGSQPAIPASDLTAGDVMVWNGGGTETIVEIADVSAHYRLAKTTYAGGGGVLVKGQRRLKKDRLVAVEGLTYVPERDAYLDGIMTH